MTMLDFKFCACCGGDLVVSQLPTEDRPRLNCSRCGYVHYLNPKIVCGTLPAQDGKVWLLRRGIAPRLGCWTYPAGYQEWGESSEEAALRETREEIGCNVELDRLLGVFSRPGAPVVNIVYLARVQPSSSTPCVTPEATQVKAFSPSELPWDELAFSSTEEVLRAWIACVGEFERPADNQSAEL